MQRDEIDFKQVATTLKSAVQFLLSKWILILCVGLLGGVIGLTYAFLSKPKYTASLNFILSNNSGSSSGLMGLAGQFGIDLGSNSNDAFSGDNIISLMTSRTMVQRALLKKMPETGELFINYLVKDDKADEAWQSKSRTKGAYPFPSDSSKFSLVQDSLFRAIYTGIRDHVLSVSRPDKNLSIYQVNATSKNELTAYYLTNYLVEVTSKFYIDTKTSVAKSNLNMLQHEADSLSRILSGSITSTARVFDNTFNLNSALQSQRAPAQEGQLRITALGTAYSEVVRNLEIAKITLQKETPLYQIIDKPVLPLEAEKPGKLTSLVIGGFLAGLLIVFFLLFRRFTTQYFK